MPRPSSPEEAANGIGALDELLQHRTRLGICVLLAKSDALSFSRLKELLGETDGNLGAHLRKLEDSGYLELRREFVARKPVSWYSLSVAGRAALSRHMELLSGLIASLKPGKEKSGR